MASKVSQEMNETSTPLVLKQRWKARIICRNQSEYVKLTYHSELFSQKAEI